MTSFPRRCLRRLDKLLSGRHWILIVVLLATMISLFFAFPGYRQFRPNGADWQAILRNARHPFNQAGLTSTDRAYNFTFRVTVPLIGGRLHLSPAGYLVLQALAGLSIFGSTAHLVNRLTSSRRLAALASIAVGLTWAGATAFIEIRGDFDAVAIAFLLGAMATRRPTVAFVCTFLAAWTDERAIPAIAFVVLLHHIAESQPDLRFRRLLRQPLCLAAAAGLIAHLATRVLASWAFDLHQPSNVGLDYIKKYIGQLFVGAWTGLEGLWVLAVLGALALLRKREFLVAAAFAGAVALIVVISISVTDITRSMAYLLPAAFVGLAALARWCEPRLIRSATYLCLVLCTGWPIYYVGGESKIYLAYPAIMQVFRRIAGLY